MPIALFQLIDIKLMIVLPSDKCLSYGLKLCLHHRRIKIPDENLPNRAREPLMFSHLLLDTSRALPIISPFPYYFLVLCNYFLERCWKRIPRSKKKTEMLLFYEEHLRFYTHIYSTRSFGSRVLWIFFNIKLYELTLH